MELMKWICHHPLHGAVFLSIQATMQVSITTAYASSWTSCVGSMHIITTIFILESCKYKAMYCMYEVIKCITNQVTFQTSQNTGIFPINYS